MKILLVSHGDFAQGICSTMRNFFGGENLYSACVTRENGVEDLKETVEAYLAEWGDEQVVICSDLKAGSANQTVFPYITRPNTLLISGMNLSLLLQLSMEDEVDIETVQSFIDQARDDMVLMNTLALGDDEDE